MASSDPPPSPKIENPIKTLDDESSPTAPIRALVTHSLAISSPIRQIQNPDESPSDKTQVTPDDNNNKSYIPSFDYLSDYDDDDHKMEEPAEPFSWSYIKNEPTGVGAGLYNSGNTCFIASVLQCFTHTVPLLDSLRSYKYQDPCNCGNESFCVLKSLRDHIELALRSSGYDLQIHRFRDNINYFSPDFQINNQEDAHEFLQSFLDKLERCSLNLSARNQPSAVVSSQGVNIVDNVFGGRLVSKLRCCNCNSISEIFEPSVGWSLEIDDVEDLSSALESFTCVEKLEDQLTCDDCKEKVSKEKQLKFDKLPLVATFHLKRFKNDGVYMEKIFKDVKFPLELDMLPYMSSNENPEVSTKYYLYAMVEHLGSGVHFGHYSSYVRSAPGTWHHFDDAKVRRISEDCVLSKTAYMLFYAREGTPWFSSAFEELKTLYEATPVNFSPTSVLETTCREECNANKACNGSVGVSNPGGSYSDYRCDEPQDEVFYSAEPISYDTSFAFKSPPKADESRKPFAETSHQEEATSYPAGNKGTTTDASVPELKIQEEDPSPKRKAAERATIGEEAYLPKPKIQKPNSFAKGPGTFQIQREHLQNKKKEETPGTKPFRIPVPAASVADVKEKEHAIQYLRNMPSSRSRMLAAAIGVDVKKKNISNIRRSNLHRNLSGRPSS
ncbi:Ubiquitin carboxyl-terminal hydrolase 21 [Hirschfeldia incana]|nr:Ubiquitin carboxyl-terminal hydrolase 21 [Hirschfeldia incana]